MQHDVSFTIPYRSLGKSDIRFKVFANNEKLGELQVSNGALVWFPKNKKIGNKLGWSKFDKLIRDLKRAEKR
jgi:hypothetical protein